MHLAACALQQAARLRACVRSNHDARPDREDVAALLLEHVGSAAEPADSALVQRLEERDRREWLVDERQVVGDGRDHAQEVEELLGAPGVREIEALERNSLVRQDRGELLVSGRVRPVAAGDCERHLVEPEHVAAVRDRAVGERSDARDAEVGERGAKVCGLPPPDRLRHLQLNVPARRDEHRVVCETRVDEPFTATNDGDVDSEAREELDERGVVTPEPIEVGHVAPAGCREVAVCRLAYESPLERGRGRAHAVPGVPAASLRGHGLNG